VSQEGCRDDAQIYRSLAAIDTQEMTSLVSVGVAGKGDDRRGRRSARMTMTMIRCCDIAKRIGARAMCYRKDDGASRWFR
jgi:hypothetical protein